MNKKIAYFLVIVLSFVFLASGVKAVASSTLSLVSTTGDNVQVTVTGEPSSSIRLSFLPAGASTVTSIVFGTTDSNGRFSTTISSGGYGIPQGSPVYVIVNGMQSTTMLWPNYVSSLSLSQTSINISPGQIITVTGSNALILAANGMSSVIGAVLSGSQVTITGLSVGSGSLALCSANMGCGSISVVVGGQGQRQISFSQNNFTLSNGQTKNIDIYGGTNVGFKISSNSNSEAVEASISGSSNVVSLFGGRTPGTATISVCSKEDASNCANLNVTTLSSVANSLSFSQNNITLNPGVAQNIIVSGGPDNNYYISSNSSSGVASVSIASNILTLVGGNNSGSTVISVCSATANATCSNLNVSLTLNSTAASDTALSFSQNVVSVSKKDTSNVTVAGGSGGYIISSNSNPTAVTATITGNTNIISIYGAEVGSSVVTVCAATGGSVCASIYVSVGPELAAIYFSQSNAVVTSGNKTIVTIGGGSGTGKVISLNSNPSAVTATLNSDGSVLSLGGGSVSGTANITVCSATYSSNCATLKASYTAPVTTENTASVSDSTSSSNTNVTVPVIKTLIEIIIAEAADVMEERGFIKDAILENKNIISYTNPLVSGDKKINAAVTKLITNFITYGTVTTRNMGTGERAGVLSSYKKAFGKLPATENEWTDAVKIANGRWPGEANQVALEAGKVEFKKVYKREANLSNKNDDAAVSIIAYGLRPTSRNIDSEKAAIKSFKAIYGHNPVSALAWDIVRAIAYSGAKR